MPIGEKAHLEWRRFDDFSTERLYDMLRFRQAIFVVEQASPFPDLDGLDQHAHHLLLGMGDGALAGYARLIPSPAESRVAIGRVAVAARWRRRGLARLILREALSRCCRDYPDHLIALSAQTHLVPFYQSFGFRAISPPADDYGIPHVEMELSPANPPSDKQPRGPDI